MSDREKQTLEEIKQILGFPATPQDMLNNIAKAVERREKEDPSPNSTPEDFIRRGFTFQIKDVRFSPELQPVFFGASSLKIDPVDGTSTENLDEEEYEDEENGEKELYDSLDRRDKFLWEMEDCLSIFLDRNSIYRDTFVHLGLMGTVTTLIGDCFRLRNMILHESDHGRSHVEQIEDKLRDVVNQAIISLMMLHEENFEGK